MTLPAAGPGQGASRLSLLRCWADHSQAPSVPITYFVYDTQCAMTPQDDLGLCAAHKAEIIPQPQEANA